MEPAQISRVWSVRLREASGRGVATSSAPARANGDPVTGRQITLTALSATAWGVWTYAALVGLHML